MSIFINSVHATLESENYQAIISTGKHKLVADEPIEKGGKDSGTEAHNFLCAGLASCTAITLKMYLNRKGWDLGAIQVDCELKRVIESGIQKTSINQLIKFGTNPNDVQKKRILIIAGKCPVHKTLSSGIDINTQIK